MRATRERLPWTSRPQPPFLAMAEGACSGASSGCVTGEHAVMAANLGLEAIGMDTAGTAMRVRKHKAR